MLDRLLMLQMKLPLLGTIHLQGNKFVTGVKFKATGDSKLNDSPYFLLHKKKLLLPN